MRLVSTQEMRDLEQAADDAGLTYAEMMENAGRAVAEVVDGYCAEDMVLVLVGPGNNGGDGLVAARYLAEWGYDVAILIWRRDLDDDPNLTKVQEAGLPVMHWSEDEPPTGLQDALRQAGVIVDALLGTGAEGPLRGGLPELFDLVRDVVDSRQEETGGVQCVSGLNAAPYVDRPLIVAVDVPSGLDADSGEIDERALRADITVTFAYPKRGQFAFPGADYVGRLYAVDIGISSAVEGADEGAVQVMTASEVAAALPDRPRSSHKGTFGKAMIVAGSVNYTGAPSLAAGAAYRVGAGLVTLAIPQAIHPIVAACDVEATYLLLPHAMGVLVPNAARVLAERIEDYDALLIGPGLGRESETGEFIASLLTGGGAALRKSVGFRREEAPPEEKRLELPPLVLDADALNLLSDMPEWWQRLPKGAVLTPHPGEMARLTGSTVEEVANDRLEVARSKATEWGCTIVLKGAYTVIASTEGEVRVIPFATPALATAGTGDVLAGAIVGLVAQGLDGLTAATCGAYLHGLAGQLAAEENGQAGTIASDLLPLLPQARRHLCEGLGDSQDTSL